MAYQGFLDQNRKFGIEIECFGLEKVELRDILAENNILSHIDDHYKDPDYGIWLIGEDGTIGSDPGIELRSPQLHGLGVDGLLQLGKVVRVLHDAPRLKVDDSCSLHVHWDVSDYTGWDLINLLKIYAKYEPIIDFFVAEERRGDSNIHCRSLIKRGGFCWIDELYEKVGYAAYQVADLFQSQVLSPVTSFPSARHHKLNPVSVLTYGTVEFRQHQGTLDWEEIKNWVLFTGQLINRAKSDVEVGGDKITLGDMVKFLRLTDTQLGYRESEEFFEGEFDLLSDMRDYYKKVYRENKKND